MRNVGYKTELPYISPFQAKSPDFCKLELIILDREPLNPEIVEKILSLYGQGYKPESIAQTGSEL